MRYKRCEYIYDRRFLLFFTIRCKRSATKANFCQLHQSINRNWRIIEETSQSEVERYQQEARDSACHAGRLMRLMFEIWLEARKSENEQILELIEREAENSPWLKSKIEA